MSSSRGARGKFSEWHPSRECRFRGPIKWNSVYITGIPLALRPTTGPVPAGLAGSGIDNGIDTECTRVRRRAVVPRTLSHTHLPRLAAGESRPLLFWREARVGSGCELRQRPKAPRRHNRPSEPPAASTNRARPVFFGTAGRSRSHTHVRAAGASLLRLAATAANIHPHLFHRSCGSPAANRMT
jgi:hypothetical protein